MGCNVTKLDMDPGTLYPNYIFFHFSFKMNSCIIVHFCSFVAWIGSLQIALTFLLSPVASIIVDKFGIRASAVTGALIATVGMFSSSYVKTIELYYLTYGLFLGAGSSLVYTPSVVILGHYFKKRLGIVNGVVSFGSAVFTIVLPLLMKECLKTYGVQWTMRILSALYALLILCALTWKPQYSGNSTKKSVQTGQQGSKLAGFKRSLQSVCNVSIWRNKGYRVWAIALPVAFLGYFIPFVHLVCSMNTGLLENVIF